jgi:hypothetical protein
MRLEYIVYQHKKADVIFSKDPRIENGIVNTGMFIIKNIQMMPHIKAIKNQR